jgi:putative endonuclease
VDTCPTYIGQGGEQKFLLNMKYYVYILKSKKTNKTYTGYTNNLERRLKEHNSGKSNFTSKYIPWELIYKEEFDKEIEARKKEKYYKTSAGRQKLKFLLNN